MYIHQHLIQGIEPEAIVVGEIGGQAVIFAGIERPGAIAIFSAELDASGDPQIQFESIYYGSGTGKSWQQLYDDRELVALAVEDLVYVSVLVIVKKSLYI